jgi:hypothetical protein
MRLKIQGFTLVILFFAVHFSVAQTRMAPIKASFCKGPGQTVYETRSNASGIVFRNWEDSLKRKMLRETVVLPIKTTLNFKPSSQPLIACDLSNAEYKGRIYICWCDVKNGVKNEDIFLSFSEDTGKTWCEPILLTYYPNHKIQNKPFLFVDQSNGKVMVLFYDAFNSTDGSKWETILALSSNGGLKFDNYFLNEKRFSGDMDPPFIKAEKGKICAHWFEPGKNIEEKVFCLSDTGLFRLNAGRKWNAVSCGRSALFRDQIIIPMAVSENLKMSAIITKPLEPAFEKILFLEKVFTPADKELRIDTKKIGLKKGNYVVTLYYCDLNRYVWITEQ